jgi:alcohol oxidase
MDLLDCSVAPENAGGNTYSTAIAIGEKAAILIAEDLEILFDRG